MTWGLGVRLDGVVKHYRTGAGTVRAVDGIDLEVAPGSSIAVMGPSGCGKSTLLGLIGGLEPPTGGAVTLGAERISALGEADRARIRRERIGFLFQSHDLLPFLTAAENVGFQFALRGAGEDPDRVDGLLAGLGLAEHADKLPDQLSGGQRQRVGIARALVHLPRLILADEPTGELDRAASDAVVELLVAAQRDAGATLVVVTHDREVASRLERTVRLRDGRLEDA
ncbi:MAG TPA: ABC transporter ATP-binding protein [Candidatus Dormibacteraeota bacterium]